MTIHHDSFYCLLCRRTGEQLVAPGEVPSLFVLQEHLVGGHGAAWEDVLLASPQPAGEAETAVWTLPGARAAVLGLPTASYLRVARGRHTCDAHFYFAASFPTRERCLHAEMEIIDTCKRTPTTSLCGGEAGMGDVPLVLFVARQPGRTPPLDFQRAVWATIHRFQGTCLALPRQALDDLLLLIQQEILINQAMNPGVRWAEVDYRTGTVFHDAPTRSEAAREMNNL